MARGKQTLTQRIALDGDDELKKDLEALGETGKRAFEEMQNATKESTTRLVAFRDLTRGLQKEFDQLRKKAAELGKSFRDFNSAARDVARNAAIMAGVVTGAVGALVGLSTAAAQAADEHGKTAQSLGFTIDQYGKLQYVLEQNNVSQEKFVTSMTRLNVKIEEAADRTSTSAKLFRDLGVQVRFADGSLRNAGDVIGDLADVFQTMPDGVRKSAAAVELFGRTGPQIIPFLNSGKKGLFELGEEAERLGITFTEAKFAIGRDMLDAFNRLRRTVQGVRDDFGLLFAPLWTRVATELTAVVIKNRDAILEWGRQLRNFLMPIVGDLIALMQGRDADVQNTFIITLRDRVVLLVDALRGLYTVAQVVFTALRDLIQPVLDVINDLFGTDLQANQVLVALLLAKILGIFRLLGAAVAVVRAGVGLLLTAFAQFAIRLAAVGAVITGIVQMVSDALAAIDAFLLRVVDGIASLFGQASEETAAATEDMSARASEAFEGVAADAATAAQDTSSIWVDGAEAIRSAFDSVIGWVGGLFTRLGDLAAGIINRLISMLDNLIRKAKEALRAVGLAGGRAGGGPVGFARGGAVRGPGGHTSDSIPAMLSAGEFVMQWKAVRRYGLAFMRKLNAGLIDIPGLAGGGLVGPQLVPMPALAGGGPAGRPLTLVIDGETFAGLTAPSDVMEELTRFATNRALRSGGRKPSWYTG